MIKQEFRVLGHKIHYNVAESSEEFNKLDPKRKDAARDEAVNNIVYRSMNPDTRYWFLHGFSADDAKKLSESNPGTTYELYDGVEEETGIPRKTEPAKNKAGEVRMKDGVEVTKFIEPEEVYYNRVIATLVSDKKYASEDVAREHFQPFIERIASYVPFDVTEAEHAERGPKKLAAKYKIAAAKAMSIGTVEKLNKLFEPAIGKTFTATNDSTKMFSGKYPHKDSSGDETQVDFSVSDKDAEQLGWLVKEYQDWKASQELAALTE